MLIRAIRGQNKKLSLLSQLFYNKHLQNLRYLRAKENQRLGKIKHSKHTKQKSFNCFTSFVYKNNSRIIHVKNQSTQNKSFTSFGY